MKTEKRVLIARIIFFTLSTLAFIYFKENIYVYFMGIVGVFYAITDYYHHKEDDKKEGIFVKDGGINNGNRNITRI